MASSRISAVNENISTFGGGTRDYTGLGTWESDTDNDLVTAAQSEVLECHADAAGYDQGVSLGGATVNSSYFRIVRAAADSKHNGTVNCHSFKLLKTSDGAALTASENFVIFQDIVVNLDIDSASAGVKAVQTSQPYTDTKFIGLIVYDCTNVGTGNLQCGIEIDGQDSLAVNCLVYGCDEQGFNFVGPATDMRAYNCTAIDNGQYGFDDDSDNLAGIVINCLGSGNGTFDFDELNPGAGDYWPAAADYNASADGSAPGNGSAGGGNSRINQTFDFRDAGNNDYHLTYDDGGARNFGDDLSSDSFFDFDDAITPINAVEYIGRSVGNWDIGAFEYRIGVKMVRSGGVTGTSFAFDIGDPDNHRMVAIFAADESSGTSLTGLTVDGKAATKITEADNSNGLGNHLELWVISEEDLGASAGSVTIAITGGNTGWAINAMLFYEVIDDTEEEDSEIENTVTSSPTISVENVTVPDDGLVIMAACQGSSGNATGFTSPLIRATEGPDPSSAVLATAYGVELTRQDPKTYVCTMSVTFNRGTGIVASFRQALPSFDVLTDIDSPIFGGQVVR